MSLHRPSCPHILAFWVTYGVETTPLRHGWSWHPPQTPSHIIKRKYLSQWYAVSRAYGCTIMLLHRPCWPQILPFWSLVELKWYHYVMVEADIHLRTLPKSILGKEKLFESLLCCLTGIWVNQYVITQAKFATVFGILGHLWSWNSTILLMLRLTSTSDPFSHPY